MPTAIFNNLLQIYVEADELSGANASTVASFTDLSGYDRHLTSVGAGGLPVIQTSAVNGKKSVKWTGGGIVPLGNATTFQIKCFVIVCKVSQTTFSGYNGLVSPLTGSPILTGNQGTTNWFDAGYYHSRNSAMRTFEYRLNDRIHSPSEAHENGAFNDTHNPPAPMQEWAIIFCKFWEPQVFNGLQLGGDRDFADRPLVGEIAAFAPWNRHFTPEDELKIVQSFSYAYQIGLYFQYPLYGSKGDPVGGGKDVLTDGQPEPVVTIIGNTRKRFERNFGQRSGVAVKTEGAFYEAFYPNSPFLLRNVNRVPFEDTAVIYSIPQEKQYSENQPQNSFTRTFQETNRTVDKYIPTAPPNFPNEVNEITDLDGNAESSEVIFDGNVD